MKSKGMERLHEEQHAETGIHQIETLDDLKKALTIKEPTNLMDFLHLINLYMPLIL